ncbi:uncharacterized protein KGF55_000282 [Candida pseudojiufengensis]|uniref:uncharacterized protein n=1 Tax=Candida pseudojiufengensis TaxID=497109 RepID=UPI002223F11B|nr:uncharacterized protein KGF55_000282 [Candida pseudojiufengensis]KAI5966873.1 hypothetical protein KGF55_000282 [Candida pseudojiufengensis]
MSSNDKRSITSDQGNKKRVKLISEGGQLRFSLVKELSVEGSSIAKEASLKNENSVDTFGEDNGNVDPTFVNSVLNLKNGNSADTKDQDGTTLGVESLDETSNNSGSLDETSNNSGSGAMSDVEPLSAAVTNNTTTTTNVSKEFVKKYSKRESYAMKKFEFPTYYYERQGAETLDGWFLMQKNLSKIGKKDLVRYLIGICGFEEVTDETVKNIREGFLQKYKKEGQDDDEVLENLIIARIEGGSAAVVINKFEFKKPFKVKSKLSITSKLREKDIEDPEPKNGFDYLRVADLILEIEGYSKPVQFITIYGDHEYQSNRIRLITKVNPLIKKDGSLFNYVFSDQNSGSNYDGSVKEYDLRSQKCINEFLDINKWVRTTKLATEKTLVTNFNPQGLRDIDSIYVPVEHGDNVYSHKVLFEKDYTGTHAAVIVKMGLKKLGTRFINKSENTKAEETLFKLSGIRKNNVPYTYQLNDEEYKAGLKYSDHMKKLIKNDEERERISLIPYTELSKKILSKYNEEYNDKITSISSISLDIYKNIIIDLVLDECNKNLKGSLVQWKKFKFPGFTDVQCQGIFKNLCGKNKIIFQEKWIFDPNFVYTQVELSLEFYDKLLKTYTKFENSSDKWVKITSAFDGKIPKYQLINIFRRIDEGGCTEKINGTLQLTMDYKNTIIKRENDAKVKAKKEEAKAKESDLKKAKYEKMKEADLKKQSQKSRKPWTAEEDKKLMELCKEKDGKPNWLELSSNFKDRTENSCLLRYQKLIAESKKDPKLLRKGAWSIKEDMVLRALVQKYGNDWSKIDEEFPTRTKDQMQKRWCILSKSSK